jgi:tRNA(Ile)-lysidine synthase TilS/MesJ
MRNGRKNPARDRTGHLGPEGNMQAEVPRSAARDRYKGRARDRRKLAYAQKTCLSKAGRLMLETSMLHPGARVGVAVSGGEDSWVLLQVLLLHRRKLPFGIDLMALHVNPGFDPGNHAPMRQWLLENGVAGHLEVGDMGPRAHTGENRSNSPCFFCSWRRRKRLFQLVRKYGLTHLALGHNSDDLVENFFMNIAYAGRVEGMYPRESFFGGRFELLRPLLMVEKKTISKAAREWKFPVWSNPCPSDGATKRKAIRDWLEELWGKDRRLRKNTFSALQRWQGKLARGAGAPSPKNDEG